MRAAAIRLWLIATAATGVGLAADDGSRRYDSYAGQAPPELISAPEHWVNRDGKLTLAGLKGKLVWLQFNF